MTGAELTTRAMKVHGAALVAGLLHHADHVVRRDVGWPLGSEVNAFTYSLVVYPVVALGLWRTRPDRPLRGYWIGVALVGLAFVAVTHAGPAAPDPVGHVHAAYESEVAGAAAVAVLGALLLSLVVLLIWAVRLPHAGQLAGAGAGTDRGTAAGTPTRGSSG